MSHPVAFYDPAELCELCGHIIHPLCSNGNCQDTPHAAPGEEWYAPEEAQDMRGIDGNLK